MEEIPTPPKANTSQKAQPREVRFTREQAEYIDKIFGERVGPDPISLEVANLQRGQRNVVKHIWSKVAG